MERAFKCGLCSDKLISQSKLNHHMGREHLAKKHFKCNVCGNKFIAKQNLIVHMRTHTGERPFKCTVGKCEMEFKQKSALNRHMKSKHRDERPFKCNFPGCKYGAKISDALRGHLKKHSDDRPLACPNEGCKFRTIRKSNLTRHLTAAHSTAEAFPCSQCDYKATRKDHLKSHMLRRHSTRRDNTKCSHSECAEYLICSYDLKCLLSNQDEENSSPCDQYGREQILANTNEPCDPNRYVNSEPSVACRNPNSSRYSTRTAEDFHTSEAENRENIEPNKIHTLPSLSKDSGYSCSPDVRPGRGGNEPKFFHVGFNWLDVLQSSSL